MHGIVEGMNQAISFGARVHYETGGRSATRPCKTCGRALHLVTLRAFPEPCPRCDFAEEANAGQRPAALDTLARYIQRTVLNPRR